MDNHLRPTPWRPALAVTQNPLDVITFCICQRTNKLIEGSFLFGSLKSAKSNSKVQDYFLEPALVHDRGRYLLPPRHYLSSEVESCSRMGSPFGSLQRMAGIPTIFVQWSSRTTAMHAFTWCSRIPLGLLRKWPANVLGEQLPFSASR
jgi:hypothetical protein